MSKLHSKKLFEGDFLEKGDPSCTLKGGRIWAGKYEGAAHAVLEQGSGSDVKIQARHAGARLSQV